MPSEPAVLSFDGQETKLPVVRGTEDELGVDIAKLRAQTGLITLDYGYLNTGSCESAITYIDGDEGILRYRGIPIEQLVSGHQPSFLETTFLLIYGELPTRERLDDFLCRSTLIKPRSPTTTPALSAATVAPFGRRPTATRTRS
jgi:citrate synthase